MSPWRLERERPSEWLRWLNEEPDAYQMLIAEAGGLARAAYRVASANCRVQGGSLGLSPTLRELQAAASVIARRLDLAETLPISSLLASDCEEQQLPVIRPLPPSRKPASVPSLRRAS